MLLFAKCFVTFNAKAQSHIIYQSEEGKFKSTGNIHVLVNNEGSFLIKTPANSWKQIIPPLQRAHYRPQAFLVAVGSMQKCHQLADNFMPGFQNERVISSSFYCLLAKPHPHLQLPLAP